MTEVLNKMTNCQRMTQNRSLLLAVDEPNGSNSQLRIRLIHKMTIILIQLNKQHRKMNKTFQQCTEREIGGHEIFVIYKTKSS